MASLGRGVSPSSGEILRVVPGHMDSALPHWAPLYSATSYSLCNELSNRDLKALKCSLIRLPPTQLARGDSAFAS